MNNLTGKRVLITGAGHGLGLETARAFARAGALVLITDREPHRVHEALSSLQSEALAVAGYVMDVGDADGVQRVREQILRDYGPIHVLVNNAGIVTGGNFLDVPIDRHLTTQHVNTGGVIIVTHTFLPDLLLHEEAAIVNIASASAMIALPNAATYAASKWAVLGFTESLREELRLHGAPVTVTSICPSYIATGMFNGVKPPLLAPLLKPEWLAGKIVTCVRKKREHFTAPFLTKLIPIAKATWPRAAFRWLLTVMGVYRSMEDWRGHTPRIESGAPPASAGTRTSRYFVRNAG